MSPSGLLPVFEYRDYRRFLKDQIADFPNEGRGVRARLAAAMSCQMPYLSHVFAGRCDLSAEQAEAAARFFALSDEEIEFFLLLVSFNRAGTPGLRRFLSARLDLKSSRNRELKKVVKIEKSLGPEERARYYSHWSFAAIHVAISVPALRTLAAIAEKFRLPTSQVQSVLQFLVAHEMAERKGSQYFPKQTLLHLQKGAAALLNHHMNWRVLGMEALSHEGEHDMHYSAALSCSKEDLARIRTLLSDSLSASIEITKPSPEETVVGLCMDLFEL